MRRRERAWAVIGRTKCKRKNNEVQDKQRSKSVQ